MGKNITLFKAEDTKTLLEAAEILQQLTGRLDKGKANEPVCHITFTREDQARSAIAGFNSMR